MKRDRSGERLARGGMAGFCAGRGRVFRCVVILSLWWTGSVYAQVDGDGYQEGKTLSLQRAFGTVSEWRLTTYAAPNAEYSTKPARFCFWRDPAHRHEQCYVAYETLSNNVAYPFQTFKEVSVVPLMENGQIERGVLIVANHSGTQDGLLSLSVWVYRQGEDRFSIATPPLLVLTWQSDYRVLSKTGQVLKGLLVTANRFWNAGDGERLFAPHRFMVRIYAYDIEHRFYRPLAEYLTARKYKSLDDVEAIDVIVPEMKEILRRASRAAQTR